MGICMSMTHSACQILYWFLRYISGFYSIAGYMNSIVLAGVIIGIQDREIWTRQDRIYLIQSEMNMGQTIYERWHPD